MFPLIYSGKWPLSGVCPVPKTWRRKPGLCSLGVASVRWTGENECENGWLDVSCTNVPISKLDLAEVVLEAPPTLVTYKRTAGPP